MKRIFVVLAITFMGQLVSAQEKESTSAELNKAKTEKNGFHKNRLTRLNFTPNRQAVIYIIDLLRHNTVVERLTINRLQIRYLKRNSS